ncbi:glycosyltransferase [Shewanella youngdeokensis]|uniref:Glycosyltransferase n=1 Tax=Shewanella youngdeokensis TaxID=2999068 RepID=A0ABZ0JWD7_9GAMM|nr:glycosyltransferase [Shewanella sp. DAU334]
MFQHFVITRFNLRKKDWQTTRTNTEVLTDKWMENRLALFENFCFSSLKSQTEKNFTWLVFFDATTPDVFRQVITRLQNEFSSFVPVYIDGMDAFLPSIVTEIQTRLTQPYLITSRLDNDDSLHQDYIKEVQLAFAKQDFMAIDFIDGLTLEVEPKVRIAKRSHVHNPFLSLIEKSDGFKTVWTHERHGQWSKVKQVTAIRNKPMWMSVIHMENKINDFDGYSKIDWKEIEAFNLDKGVLETLQPKVVTFDSWKRQSLKNQLRANWKVGFKLLKRKLLS